MNLRGAVRPGRPSSGVSAEDTGHSRGGPVQTGSASRAASSADEYRLALDGDPSNVDVRAHFCHARGCAQCAGIRCGARLVCARGCARADAHQKRRVCGKFLACRPRPRAGNDEAGVVGDHDGLHLALVSDVRELVMERDQRVAAALPSTVFDRGHAQSVSRGRFLGQLSTCGARPFARRRSRMRASACGLPRLPAASIGPP